ARSVLDMAVFGIRRVERLGVHRLPPRKLFQLTYNRIFQLQVISVTYWARLLRNSQAVTRATPGIAVPALRRLSAAARPRWFHAGQAIVRMRQAGRDRSRRRAVWPPCPASPSAAARSATAGRAAPRGGNDGSRGSAR